MKHLFILLSLIITGCSLTADHDKFLTNMKNKSYSIEINSTLKSTIPYLENSTKSFARKIFYNKEHDLEKIIIRVDPDEAPLTQYGANAGTQLAKEIIPNNAYINAILIKNLNKNHVEVYANIGIWKRMINEGLNNSNLRSPNFR